MKGPVPKPEAERFWVKVGRRGPDECWLWTASVHSNGYAAFYRNRNVKGQSAARVAWELTNGPIPDGLHVCHKCDVPLCMNPGHFFLGTAGDNARDRDAKGRTRWGVSRGESHGCSKLTEQQVMDIRANYALCRVTQRELADRYGVDRTNIGMIVRGKTWREHA